MKKLFSKLMLVAMAAMTFAACEDVPEPYDKPGTGDNQTGSTEIEGATGIGTKDDPFNAAAALNLGNTLAPGEETATYYYIKGKVVSIKEEFTTQYGNGTFYISSDGTTANQFYAYRVMYLGNKKFATGDEQVKQGDDVVVCAKITNYNGTIETVQKEGFLYELNGVNRGGEPDDNSTTTGEAKGTGTLEDPFNSVGAIKYAQEVGDTESPKDVYIKGKVASITEQYGTQYGNATFTISDDGTANGAFTVYRALYLGNQKYTSGDLLKEGDEVVVCGRVTNFKGNTPETVTGKAYLYSLNGKTDNGTTPQPGGEAKGTGTLEDPFNAAAANAYASSLAADVESDKDIYIKGKIIDIAENNQFNTQYGNCTFYISDDGTDTGDKFYVFRTLYLGNVKYTSGDLPKKGDEVIICGKVVNYKGNTPETAANKSYIYSLNGKTEGGGSVTPDPQPGEAKGTGTLEDPFNAAAANAYASSLAADAKSDKDVYIKGIIIDITSNNQFNTQYGNCTFYISDDGTDTADKFYVFRTLYLGNQKYTSGDLPKKGDEVIICGKVTNYKGNTPETVQNESYIYSLNGKTEGTNTNPNPDPQPSGNSTTIDFSQQGYENAAEVTTVTLTDGTTLTFNTGTNKNAPKYYNSGTAIRMYPGNFFTVSASKKISSIEIICSANNAQGQVTASPGTVATADMTVTVSAINANSTTITNAHTGTGADSQLRIAKLTVNYAE